MKRILVPLIILTGIVIVLTASDWFYYKQKTANPAPESIPENLANLPLRDQMTGRQAAFDFSQLHGKQFLLIETTTDLAAVRVDQIHLLFDFVEDGMETSEIYIMSNLGERTVREAVILDDGQTATSHKRLLIDTHAFVPQPYLNRVAEHMPREKVGDQQFCWPPVLLASRSTLQTNE